MPPRPISPPPEEVGSAVAALEAATVRVEAAKAELDAAKSFLHDLRTTVIPDVFSRHGVTSASIPSGAQAKTTIFITGALPKIEDDPEAHAAAVSWAEENGYKPLIKTVVEAKYGRDERDKALELFERLRGDNSAEVSMDETIHHTTLQAMVRQRLKDGLPIPLETLGVTVLDGVKLTKRSTTS